MRANRSCSRWGRRRRRCVRISTCRRMRLSTVRDDLAADGANLTFVYLVRQRRGRGDPPAGVPLQPLDRRPRGAGPRPQRSGPPSWNAVRLGLGALASAATSPGCNAAGAKACSISRRSFTAVRRLVHRHVGVGQRLAGLDRLQELDVVGEAERQAAEAGRLLGRQQLAPDGVAAFAVEHLAGLEVALGGGDDVGVPAGRRSRSARRAGRRRRPTCRPPARSGASACTAWSSGPLGSVLQHVLLEAVLLMYSVSPRTRPTRPCGCRRGSARPSRSSDEITSTWPL